MTDPTGTPRTYRRRPKPVEAIRWTGNNTAEVITWADANGGTAWHREATDRAHALPPFRIPEEHIELDHNHGVVTFVRVGQWIVRQGDGSLQAFTDERFAEEYEPVTTEETGRSGAGGLDAS